MFIRKPIVKSVMILSGVITLFACEGNYKEIQRLNLADNAPVTEGKDINMKYTDSGRVTYNLITPQLMDYSNFTFSYQEFPEGVEVHFWDDENRESVVTAKYAINYINTDLIDLRDDVHLVTHDSLELNAEQLYWDKKNQRIFTNRPYQIKLKNGTVNNGSMFDSNQDFTSFLSRNNRGVQVIDKSETN